MNALEPAMKALRAAIRIGGNRKSAKTFPAEPAKAPFDYVANKLSDHFTVGFAKESILPGDVGKKTYYIAGYGENNPATGVLDEPRVHALWVDDNSGHGGVLFVSADAVGIMKHDVDAVRSRLHDFALRTQCRSINVMSTHDHAGIDTMGIWGPLPVPVSGRDPKYIEFIIDKIEKSAWKAYETRRNGKIFKGTVEVPDMQEDIRLPIVYSKTLTRLRFVPADGGEEVWFVNFASHSESLQGCNSRISADFPCYFRRRIKEETGAETFYCVGCIGGMISMAIPDEKEIRANGSDFAENTEKIGRKLAGYALSIENEKELEPRISFIRREFYFEADNTILMIAAVAGLIKVDHYHIPSAPLHHGLKSEISYFEIGDMKILMIPCELFPELAYGGYLSAEESGTGFSADVNPTPLSDIIGGDVIFIGLANDEVGYVIPPNDFLLDEKVPYSDIPRDAHGRRHYEETCSLGPNTAVKIAQVTEEIIRAVNKVKNK